MTGRRLKIEAEYEKETIRIWLFHQDVLLLVELLAVTLFLWGNDAYSIYLPPHLNLSGKIIKRSHMHWEGLVIKPI